MAIKDFVRRSFELQGKDLLENVRDLTADDLAWRPAPHANPIGFILWHMLRVEDGWVQRVAQRKPHLWISDGWARRCGMPEDMRDLGFNYTLEQVAAFKTPPLDVLLGYGDAVRQTTLASIDTWDPGARVELRAPWGGTIGVEDVFLQLLWELENHGGQIAYLRGLRRGLQHPEYMGPLAPR